MKSLSHLHRITPNDSTGDESDEEKKHRFTNEPIRQCPFLLQGQRATGIADLGTLFPIPRGLIIWIILIIHHLTFN